MSIKEEDDSSGCGCCGGKRKKPAPVQKSGLSPEAAAKTPDAVIHGSAPPPSMEKAANNIGGLSKKERDQVTKALEAEMERRRRWKMLLRKGARKAAKQTAKGETSFPISIEEGESFENDQVLAATTEDEQQLAPEVAQVVEQNENVDAKRKEWIKKMQGNAAPSSPSPKSSKSESGSSKSKSRRKSKLKYDQPETLSLDAETAQEIGSHTLIKMAAKILVHSAKAQAEKKPPSEMTPDELISFRRRNPAAWDEFTNANSVASFGLAKPTPEDEEKAQKMLAKAAADRKRSNETKLIKGKPQKGRVSFDNKIQIATAPVGEDFQPGETVQFTKGHLSFEPDKLKKR